MFDALFIQENRPGLYLWETPDFRSRPGQKVDRGEGETGTFLLVEGLFFTPLSPDLQENGQEAPVRSLTHHPGKAGVTRWSEKGSW